MSPTSLFTITHFMDGETEAQKRELPEDIGLKPRPPGRDHFLLYQSASSPDKSVGS